MFILFLIHKLNYLEVEILAVFQYDIIRILQVYLVQGLVFLFFVSLSIIILKRDKKRLNKVFSGFYILVSLGLFFNFIYTPMRSDDLVIIIEILNFITNYCLLLGPIFLVIFQLILLKSEKIITGKKQTIIFVSYSIVLLSMIGFMFGEETGVDISGPNWVPIYHLPIYIYLMVVHSISSTIPTIFLSTMIYRKLEDTALRNKWRFFMVGIHSLNIFMYGTYSSYILEVVLPGFRFGWSIVGLILVVTGGYMLFYGVGRQLRKEETKFTIGNLEEIKRIMQTSTKVNLNRMQDVLGMERKNFNKEIFKWAEIFNFIIDGDYLIVNKETVSNFINYLDAKLRR